MRALLLLTAAAHPAFAQEPLSAEAFDELTRGRTYYYADEGIPYGAEEYRDDREVVWSFLDGRCIHGTWYQAGEAICFVYENFDGPQCWHFYGGDRLTARFLDGGSDLTEMARTRESLQCLGPDVGV